MCVCNRKSDQVGKALLSLPWYIVNQLLTSIDSAEDKVGRPPSVFEIFVEMKKLYPSLPVNNIYEGAAVLTSLFREDWIHMNQMATNYTTRKHEGFFNFSK